MNKKSFEEKRSFGVNSLENSLNKVLQPIFGNSKKEFILINNIIKNWQNIIGEKYARLCTAHSINFSKDRKNAKLTIIAYNSAIAFFLDSNSEQIIEKIACLYGFKSINQIVIKQQPKLTNFENFENHIFDDKQEQIFKNSRLLFANQDLANTIEQLGREIFNKSK